MLRSLVIRALPRRSSSSAAVCVLASAPCASLSARRHQSSAAPGNMEMIDRAAPEAAAVTYDQVWALWNEGNLYSLSVTQMQSFLAQHGVPADPTLRKAHVVRRVEELLHQRDREAAAAAAGGADASSAGAVAAAQAGDGAAAYGQWDRAGAAQPTALLDLAQAGFYEGAASMAPKAFQLLLDDNRTDAVVVRLNTAAFPGAASGTECYSLVSSDSSAATQSRFGKVLQWCHINMSNLRMDGELSLSLGKLILEPRAARRGETVVSAYGLQQRLQLTQPYLFVKAVPDRAAPLAAAFLEREGFRLVPPGADTPGTHAGDAVRTYEGTVQRARDRLEVSLDHTSGALIGLHGEWVSLHTAHFTRRAGPDVRLQLRSRAPAAAEDAKTFGSTRVVEVEAGDITDVLPPEHGQLVYLSENETRRYEKALPERGVRLVVTEVRRQPLIILRDDEEDPRLEYTLTAAVPAHADGPSGIDVRALGLEMLAVADSLAAEMRTVFVEDFGCVV